MHNCILSVAAFALLMTATPVAVAFEVEGMVAGQSLAATRSRAMQRGLTLIPSSDSPGVYSVARIGQFPHASITFCQGRDALFAYSGFGVGGFDAFVRMVEREEARLGAGRYAAATIEHPLGAISRVAVEWPESWWTVSVVALMSANGQVSASRGLNAFAAVCQR